MQTGNKLKLNKSIEFTVILLLSLLCSCKIIGSPGAEFNARGIKAGEAGLHEEALEWFNKAINLDPVSNHFMNRAITYTVLKQPQKAFDDYETAIKIDPNNFQAYANRGNLYDDLGQTELAINDYSQAIRLNPRDAFAYRNRAIVYIKKKEYQSALEDLDRAIEIDPNYIAAYLSRRCVYTALKRLDDAERDREKIIKLALKYRPSFPEKIPLEKLLICPDYK